MIVFCITSPNYVKYTKNLLKSLNSNITDVVSGIFCLGINLSPSEISRLKEKVTNTQIDINNVVIDFQKMTFNLEGYAVCARAIYLPEIMNTYKKDVLYVDSDIHVISCIDPLVKQIKGADWAVGIRHPQFTQKQGNSLWV